MSSIASARSDPLTIADTLHETYPKRHQTLDGRLTGDIGETLFDQTHEIALHGRKP